jgi:cellulose biosynthesis protein BcsQ
MHKIISLFNHKGGVSKTTTTFHLGWMLAEKGFKVVMIDSDPQCNLTGLVLDYEQGQTLDNFYSDHPDQNIRAALAPAFESQPRRIEAIDCIEVKLRPNLYLVPGHVNLSEYEVTLGISQELSGSIQALRNLPGAFYYFAQQVAESKQADFVLVDMNPSLGAINQNLLMSSDFFVVPTAPDYFSMMAIDSLVNILPKWIAWANKASKMESLSNATYPFPGPRLKFLGSVIQKYRPMKGKATVGFQAWIDQINYRIRDAFFPKLHEWGATLKDDLYTENGVGPERCFCLAQIPDFNTLIATSQSHQVPVFALEDSMFGHQGTVLDQDRIKRAEFRDIFNTLADRVIALTRNASGARSV